MAYVSATIHLILFLTFACKALSRALICLIVVAFPDLQALDYPKDDMYPCYIQLPALSLQYFRTFFSDTLPILS